MPLATAPEHMKSGLPDLMKFRFNQKFDFDLCHGYQLESVHH